MNHELRFVATDLEVRRLPEGEGRTLEGYAATYGTLSEDLGGFRERIARGAFSKSLEGGADVRALVDHDPSKVIGRTRSGTLNLSEDEIGLRFKINVPDTQIGRDLVTTIERGDVTNMSFGFRALNDSWSAEGGATVRTVHEADLFDVSPVTYPSYPDTSIAVRSLDRWKETKMEATKQTPEDNLPPKETQVSDHGETPEDRTPEPERRSASVAPRTSETRKARSACEWRDYRTGKEVRVLKPSEKFSALYQSDEPLSLGRAIRALVVGDWSEAPAEHRALSTTANPSAGILIQGELSASVIDRARELMVLTQAGARTVEMNSSTLRIARVATDPTIESKAENSAFTGSDTTFDAVEMTAYTIGQVEKLSRELVQDAPNAVSVIEENLARTLAVKLDRYGLRGTGSAEPLGLINLSGTNTENVGGAVDYDNILNGISACEVDNHMPNTVVGSPANWNVLRQLKVAAEANHYAAPPPAVSALRSFSTSAMPDSDMIVGDFTRFLIGLRQDATIEVTTDGGDAFEKHQVFVKITWRGSFAVEHKEAFCLLQSIS